MYVLFLLQFAEEIIITQFASCYLTCLRHLEDF